MFQNEILTLIKSKNLRLKLPTNHILFRSYKGALSKKYRDVDKSLEEALMGASVNEER